MGSGLSSGHGFVLRAGGCVGRCCRDGIVVLLSQVPVGCFHVFVSRQSVPRCPCRLYEVLVEDAVWRPLGKLPEGVVVCPAAVKDPHLLESDVDYCDGGSYQVYGLDGAFGALVQVPAEDRQGSFLLACVVGEHLGF